MLLQYNEKPVYVSWYVNRKKSGNFHTPFPTSSEHNPSIRTVSYITALCIMISTYIEAENLWSSGKGTLTKDAFLLQQGKHFPGIRIALYTKM
jgi:hypothetical protein